MPIRIDLDPAIFQWQARHNERLSYAELSRRTGISLPTLHRLKNGEAINLNLDKLNLLCKVLECDVADILHKVETRTLSPEVLSDYEARQAAKQAKAPPDDGGP
jgi:DNA-binding Xre family transcriptional regulator